MLFQCVPVNHVLVVAVTRCLRLLFRLRYLRLCALRRLLYFALLQGFLQLLRLLLLFFCHCFCFFLVYILFLPVLFGTDFVALEELLHRVRLFSFRQVPDGLLVHLVIMDGHADQPEMRGVLELAPEVLDEILEDT